jgi:hypothetical protein
LNERIAARFYDSLQEVLPIFSLLAEEEQPERIVGLFLDQL